MPTYQYVCTDCGEPLEVVQKFSDASLTECPACSGRLRKVFSAAGIIFKGSGFYKTDSRAPAKSGASANGSAKSDSAGSSESKSESKPDSSGSTSGKSESKSDSKSSPKGGSGEKVA